MSYQNAYKFKGLIFQKPPDYTQMPNRSIITNVQDFDVADNSIKTSKYTLFDFIPFNLIVQFSKLPNIYFLIIGIMQMIPQITISGGFPVIFIPLGFVVGVSATKDFFQDLKRKKSDRQINHTNTKILRSNGFEQIYWKNLKIGDIIKVEQNQQFPADVILLQSSEDKLSCFIQTKNLDGETNLKYKQIKYQIGKQLREYVGQKEKQLYQLRHQFQYERPNPFIYSFTGSHKNIPLDNNNIVLRGCSLKITRWVVGLVIYTGIDTKIMLNSNKTRQKKSRLQFKMGLIVIGIFIFQMLITFASALISTIITPDISLEYNKLFSVTTTLFMKWGSWILLFTNFVPISLIVTLQMVKYIQGIRISNSSYITNQPAEVRVQTSSLNEELGQIQHVFTDKTGTLTRNYMSFKYMVIGEQTFGYDDSKTPIPQNITNVDFHDRQFFKLLKSISKDELSNIYDMLIAFSLCHNVIIQQDNEGNKKYNASSPDELAFINMAKYCGWQFLSLNQNNQLCIKIQKEIIRYKLLHIIQFDSDRKRMSVLLQKDNKIIVYCKGADNIIFKRLKNQKNKNKKIVQARIQQWSREGLRTLLFAKRQIDKKDYEKWAKIYASSLSKLQKVENDQKVQIKKELAHHHLSRLHSKISLDSVTKLIIQDQISEQQIMTQTPQVLMNRLLNDNSKLSENKKKFIEKYLDKTSEECQSSSKEIEQILQRQFDLIGATAIEDKLQDNVKQTIQMIRAANVKVWMLTGDKKQTAINIGLSCGLVSSDMAVIHWKNTIQQTMAQRQTYPIGRQCCLVATGEDLLIPMNQNILLKLVQSCKAIICCRVTPKQKQDMVWLMRKNKFTTLAIGDGANDVNMINTAHVGIGIKGVEGAQAALCSDYAISEFQILRELMLYHGRQSYRKNSQLIFFNFYKNLLLVLPQLWYGFNNHFSSATIYDPWIYQLYNVVFTAFPIIVFAIYDEQHSVEKSLKNPHLYEVGLYNKLFDIKSIIFWFTSPIIFAFMLSNINYISLQISLDSSGHMFDLLSCGMGIFAQCVIISNLKVLILAYRSSCLLSILSYSGILIFYGSSAIAELLFPFGDMRNVLRNQVRSLSYWASIIACCGIIMLIQFMIDRWGKLIEMQKQKSVDFEEIQLPLLKQIEQDYQKSNL